MRRPVSVWCLTLLVAAALPRGVRGQDATPAPATSASARAPLTGVILEDPEEKKWDLSLLAGHPVLVVVADRSASGESVEWGRGIGAARPQSVATWIVPGKVAVVSVADLRGVPGFELNGNTGDLSATQDCVINRKLSWLKYQQGQVVPAS